MTAPKWLDTTLMTLSLHYTLCLTEEDYLKMMGDCGIKEAMPFLLKSNSEATTHFVTHGDVSTYAIVCIPKRNPHTFPKICGLLVHEAAHIWQEHCRNINELEPTDEQDAYAMQHISERLITSYCEQTGKVIL